MADWQGYQFVTFVWVMVGIGLLLLFNRLFVQVRQLRSKLNIYRELLAISAFLCYLGCAVIHTYQNGRHMFNFSSDAFYALTEDQVITVLKLIFVEAFLYLPGVYLCKFDLLLLYHELAPRHLHPRIFWLVVASWFFVVVGFLVQILYLFLSCLPFERNWAIPQDPCGTTDGYFYTVWSTHIVSDVFVYITPIVIITRMKKLPTSRKLGAAAMFIIGFVNVFTAFFIMISQATNNGISWAWHGANTFLQTVQFATAIWVICFPQLGTSWRLWRGTTAKHDAEVVHPSDEKEKPRKREVKDVESILVTTGIHTRSGMDDNDDDGFYEIGHAVEQVKTKGSTATKDPEVTETAMSVSISPTGR